MNAKDSNNVRATSNRIAISSLAFHFPSSYTFRFNMGNREWLPRSLHTCIAMSTITYTVYEPPSATVLPIVAVSSFSARLMSSLTTCCCCCMASKRMGACEGPCDQPLPFQSPPKDKNRTLKTACIGAGLIHHMSQALNERSDAHEDIGSPYGLIDATNNPATLHFFAQCTVPRTRPRTYRLQRQCQHTTMRCSSCFIRSSKARSWPRRALICPASCGSTAACPGPGGAPRGCLCMSSIRLGV